MDAAFPENVFARILRGDLPSHEVYSDDSTFAFLDIHPHAPGHTLVIPRNYGEHILEASEADIAACLRTVRRLIPAVTAATGSTAATVLTNMGRDAGQTVPYLHFHIIPRGPGSRLSGDPGAAGDQLELAHMAQLIKEALLK